MTKERACANTPVMSRRTLLAGASATAFGSSSAAQEAHESEIEIWARGFREGQQKTAENILSKVNQLSEQETPVDRIKGFSQALTEALDKLAAETGDTEWHFSLSRSDTTGELSSNVRLVGFKGQASDRNQFSEIIWELT